MTVKCTYPLLLLEDVGSYVTVQASTLACQVGMGEQSHQFSGCALTHSTNYKAYGS